jgi:hypothetical protein
MSALDQAGDVRRRAGSAVSFQKERDHSAERRTLKRTADISKAMITRWVWRIDGLSKPAATFGGWGHTATGRTRRGDQEWHANGQRQRKLGDLEALGMNCLWIRMEPVTVLHLVDEISRHRQVARTTVM